MEDLGSVFTAAQQLQDFCTAQRWQFCFIGGLAVQRWGEPRLTLDADLTLLTGFGDEEQYVDVLLARFSESRPRARDIARSSKWNPLDQLSLTTCCAEDLVVHKAYANREHDWGDIEGVFIRQGQKLDLSQVRHELQPFTEVKEAPEIMDRLCKLAAKHGLK